MFNFSKLNKQTKKAPLKLQQQKIKTVICNNKTENRPNKKVSTLIPKKFLKVLKTNKK